MSLVLFESGSYYHKRGLERGSKTVEISGDSGKESGTANGGGFGIGPSPHNDWCQHQAMG